MISSSEQIWELVVLLNYMCDSKFDNICIFDILV